MVGWSVCWLVGRFVCWLVGLFKSPTPFKSAALKPFWRYLELELFRLDSLSVCLTVCWNKEKRHQQHPHTTHNTWSYVWCFKYGMATDKRTRGEKRFVGGGVFCCEWIGGEIKGEMSMLDYYTMLYCTLVSSFGLLLLHHSVCLQPVCAFLLFSLTRSTRYQDK